MKILRTTLIILFVTALVAGPSFAQQTATTPASGKTSNSGQVPVPANAGAGTSASAPAGQPSAADMQKMMAQMMEMSKVNENHKLLSSGDGTWDYIVKMWMDGDTSKKPQESKGIAVRKSIMDGRFVEMDVTGKMQMPGPDGKPKEMTFKGHAMEGYDNAKKKFVGTWMDNMGTSMMMSEGTYDPATKSFTYTAEMEPLPGMKVPVRDVLKLTDNNHMDLQWYENQGGGEKKTMEIAYTKKK